MFDTSRLVDLANTLADTNLPGIMKLRAVVEATRLLDAAEAEVIADMAFADGWDKEDEDFTYYADPTGRRLVRVGADGVLLDEALALEIAVAKHVSVSAATCLVKDVVDLHQRHPETWKAVVAGRAPVWQARGVAQTCNRYEFTHTQAEAIDKRVAPMWGRLGFPRIKKGLQAAIMAEAPQVAEAQAEKAAQARFCRTQHGDTPGTSYISALVDTADAVFLDATIDRLADLIGDQGDTRDKDHRRATALGVLATPALALSILGTHTRRGMTDDQPDPAPIPIAIAETALPTTQVFVHIHANTLQNGNGIARVEGIGPILASQLARITGNSRIRLTPVLHIGDPEPVVDAYEIPDRIRQHVIQRDIFEAFPYSSRPARHLDLDHTIPYKQGDLAQTKPSNLNPLSRRVHRAKTHCNWQLEQPTPGVYNWTTEMGQTFTITPDGTEDTTGPPDDN